ncbi:hypothetical protein AB0L05_07225 [Nonomuraea pusilla]
MNWTTASAASASPGRCVEVGAGALMAVIVVLPPPGVVPQAE